MSNKSVFSYVRTLTTRHCPPPHAAAVAIDRYLPPAEPAAANLQQRVGRCELSPCWDRQTRVDLYRFVNPTPNTIADNINQLHSLL